MTEIISVRFRPGGKQYYFDPAGLTVPEGRSVIVETGKGLEYGTCVRRNSMVEDSAVVQPLRPVVRLATDKDEKQVRENRGREKEALQICQQLVERHGLDMKLVQVEYSFDGNKILFFFTSDGRVDFRALVKDLAGIFRARIELRQIGVRDEARMLGGFGICGKPFCCAQFLDEFQPVSIKMAKTQNLSLNPTKISGTCGRLMCCLKYEQAAYEDAGKRMPKTESFVDTPDGVGNVSGVDLLQEQVQVRLDSAPESPRRYKSCEIRVLRSGKGSREGIEIPAERPPRAAGEGDAAPSSRYARRGGRDPIAVPSVLAAGGPQEDEERRGNRRRRDRRRSDKPAQQSPEKQPSRRESKPRPEGGRPQKAERPPRADKRPDRAEKLPIRPAADTTAEKKAAADRAARQQSGEPRPAENRQPNRHRPRRRPRGKGPGEG